MLEQAGVHVVYGLLGLQDPRQGPLIVRREGERIRRYVHLATGNYNPTTARIYTDLGLFTAQPGLLRGRERAVQPAHGLRRRRKWKQARRGAARAARAARWLIEREARHAPARAARAHHREDERARRRRRHRGALPRVAGRRGDRPPRARHLLPAAGRPGRDRDHPGARIVDRFLEHGRIFYFENGGKHEVYISSADWMPRNFHRRVEAMFPIEDPALKSRIVERDPASDAGRHREGAGAPGRRQYRRRAPDERRGAPALPGRPTTSRPRGRAGDERNPATVRPGAAPGQTGPGLARAGARRGHRPRPSAAVRLLFVRHAIAEDRETYARAHKDDAARPLTPEGRQKMERAAIGSRRSCPSSISSPRVHSSEPTTPRKSSASAYEGLTRRTRDRTRAQRGGVDRLLEWLDGQRPAGRSRWWATSRI